MDNWKLHVINNKCNHASRTTKTETEKNKVECLGI